MQTGKAAQLFRHPDVFVLNVPFLIASCVLFCALLVLQR